MAPAILCVDDDPLVLEVTAKALELNGFRVLQAATGGEALSLLGQAQEEISLVLLDWRLPDVRGEEIILKIKQVRPDVKLLITSGDGALAVLPPETGQLVAGFLAKPYAPRELVGAVRQTLQQAHRTAAA